MTQSSVTNNQNYMYNKINCYLLGFKTQEIQRVFASSENKSIQVCLRTMAHTVQLLWHRCMLFYYTVLLMLKLGQLIANQI